MVAPVSQFDFAERLAYSNEMYHALWLIFYESYLCFQMVMMKVEWVIRSKERLWVILSPPVKYRGFIFLLRIIVNICILKLEIHGPGIHGPPSWSEFWKWDVGIHELPNLSDFLKGGAGIHGLPNRSKFWKGLHGSKGCRIGSSFLMESLIETRYAKTHKDVSRRNRWFFWTFFSRNTLPTQIPRTLFLPFLRM